MQLRTFIANTMRDALSQVRSEMGDDAIIVASQRARGGGVMVRAALDATAANEDSDLDMDSREPDGIEFVGSFEEIFRTNLVKREIGGAKESAAAAARNFNRAELLKILRGHRAPEALAHPLAEAAEKSGLSDMTLALASALDRHMTIAPLLLDQRKALLLLGPCGAGKTAVAAKIAAQAKLAGREARLIASDIAGAGAVARLEAFAAHLCVPAIAADTATALARAVNDAVHANALAIIDTAGFDPRDARARTAYAALAQLPDTDAIGVIAASCDAEETTEVAGALVALGISRVIVTGLDTARRLGGLLAAATRGVGLAHATRTPFVSGGLETLTPLSLSRALIASNLGHADSRSTQ